MKKILSIISLSIFMLLTAGSIEDPKPPTAADGKIDTSSMLTTPVKEIENSNSENEIAAREKYEGKWYITSGKISGFDSTFGIPSIDLRDNAGNEIQCIFSESAKSSLSSLKKGDSVTLCGTIDLMMGIFSLDNCVLIESQSN